jgi:hypothetical protein
VDARELEQLEALFAGVSLSETPDLLLCPWEDRAHKFKSSTDAGHICRLIHRFSSISVHLCRCFETGGSLGRRVNVAACPSPDGSSARPSAKGGSEVAGHQRERGGDPAAFVFVPHPGRVRLQ